MEPIEIQINGKKQRVITDADRSLLSVIHEDLDLTGAKYGCGEGQCGSCTVLIDGTPTRSCRTVLRTAAGKKVTTIEGLQRDGRLHPVQEAFIELGAMQCGYCIPGVIMSCVGVLEKNPYPTDREVIKALEGNICRCGTYPRILAAIRKAASSTRSNSKTRSGGVR